MRRKKVYIYDKLQDRVIPLEERWIKENKSPYIIDDTMPLVKSPLSKTLHFDSKSAIRKHYKQHGVVEVGNDYDNGYNPEADRAKEDEKKSSESIRQNLIDRMFHGKR